MRPIPIAQFLDRLAAAPSVAAFDAAAASPPGEPGDAARVLAEREAAYLRGIAEGEARAAASFERTLAEERTAADARLRDERAAWAVTTGMSLAETIRNELDGLESRIADRAGRLLEPFVEMRIVARAVAGLREALSTLTAASEPAAIRIHGPADLLAAIREGFASTAPLEFIENDAVDVRIVAADTVIETRLGAWMEHLREAVA